jgi:hypothetical protein
VCPDDVHGGGLVGGPNGGGFGQHGGGGVRVALADAVPPHADGAAALNSLHRSAQTLVSMSVFT